VIVNLWISPKLSRDAPGIARACLALVDKVYGEQPEK